MVSLKPFRVGVEFRIGRRVGWDGEQDLLRDHLDRVIALLRSSDAIDDAQLVADLTSASLEVLVTLHAADRTTAEDIARFELGDAIREAGAYHENLLPLKDESQAKSKLNAWAGLRTPRWQYRRLETTIG